MDKNAIKKFAVWARRELIARVSQKAEQYGITKEHHGDAYAERIGEQLLTRTEQNQRKNLITRIEQEGYKQVMEEVAYTWFNRFIALRFMEINGYLPTRIRVFTDEENAFKPQILAEAIHMEMDGLDMEKVYAFKEKNQTEELFKYLIITQCNALSSILPGMFQTISDYTELLFPDNLLREGSVIQQMIELIPEEDWQDQVQIIGWLYQYYNTEPNELVYDGNMSKSRIDKELLPAATTIYTPDWAVKYMVENSLGRMWVEGHPDEALQSTWQYYLPEAEQEPQVQAQLNEIRKEYANIKPEDIRCIDPCMGSGHILCYLFDVLVQIYEAYGYSTREAAQSIVENNLYGLDIDDRAAQLAYFAVMMKARQYDRRFFTRGIQPHVMAIQESNTLEAFDHLQAQLSLDNMCLETANRLIRTFRDAKEYGSILDVEIPELDTADRLMEQIRAINGDFELMAWIEKAEALLPMLAKQAVIMGQKYDVVVTNPPYLGSSRYSAKLDSYIKANYPDEKSDLSMVMYRRALSGYAKFNGMVAYITTSSWMFLSSFEKLRKNVFSNDSIVSIVDFGTELFEGKVGHNPIVSWITCVAHMSYTMTAVRLVDYCYSRRDEKEQRFLAGENRYTAQQDNFAKIPGSPVAYWASNAMFSDFSNGNLLSEIAIPKSGLSTTDNNRFLRFWHEVNNANISYAVSDISETEFSTRWFPLAKGGEYRKWYGNKEYIVNWYKNGEDIKEATRGAAGGRIVSPEYYFKKIITWSGISSGEPSMRISENAIFGSGAKALLSEKNFNEYLALLNSNVALQFLRFLSPTLNYEAGHIGNIPVCFDSIDDVTEMVESNISLSRADWDSFETSWDFQKHPLI